MLLGSCASYPLIAWLVRFVSTCRLARFFWLLRYLVHVPLMLFALLVVLVLSLARFGGFGALLLLPLLVVSLNYPDAVPLSA